MEGGCTLHTVVVVVLDGRAAFSRVGAAALPAPCFCSCHALFRGCTSHVRPSPLLALSRSGPPPSDPPSKLAALAPTGSTGRLGLRTGDAAHGRAGSVELRAGASGFGGGADVVVEVR